MRIRFMKFFLPLPLATIAQWTNAEIIGNEKLLATGLNEIHNVEMGDLTFVDHPKYYDFTLQSAATFVFINKKLDAPEGKVLLLCEDPFEAYNTVAKKMQPILFSKERVAASAKIGDDTYISPTAFVGENVVIGMRCAIHAHVVLEAYTVIGDDVIIHAGTVIGSEAFYYKNRGTHYDKMHTAGRVVIASDVEIGANCTIDAGVSSDTVIGRGTKIDNLVQLAHDVKIGEHCLLCAQVGVSGNVRLGNRVKLYGNVGTIQNIVIADDVTVLGASNVGSNLDAGKTYLGSPCQEARAMARQWAMLKKLPEMWERLVKDDRN